MSNQPLIIAITGGSASGKTRLAQSLAEAFSNHDCYVIPEDDYYIDAGNLPGFDASTFNFDEPAAKDHTRLSQDLHALKSGQSVNSPQYDFSTHCRSASTMRRNPARIMIVEGLHLLTDPALVKTFDLTVFVEANDTIRLERRIARDMNERSRTRDSVIHQFETIVRPMHSLHVAPQKSGCDIVIENNGQPDFNSMGHSIIKQIESMLYTRKTA